MTLGYNFSVVVVLEAGLSRHNSQYANLKYMQGVQKHSASHYNFENIGFREKLPNHVRRIFPRLSTGDLTFDLDHDLLGQISFSWNHVLLTLIFERIEKFTKSCQSKHRFGIRTKNKCVFFKLDLDEFCKFNLYMTLKCP